MKKRTKKPGTQDRLASLSTPRKGADVNASDALEAPHDSKMVVEFSSFADDLDDFIEQILKS